VVSPVRSRSARERRGRLPWRYVERKQLWIAALRLRGSSSGSHNVAAGIMIPFYQAPGRMRYHAMAWDNGAIWQ